MIQHKDGGLNSGLGPETRVVRKSLALQFMKLGETFKQAVKEPFAAWLVRLWNMGIDGINLTAVGAEKLSHVTTLRLCHL